jgi:hypothetical protein
MARVPVMSLAEIYSKPTSDNKVPDAWSRSRTGHYVKKRTHGNAHISRMRENLTF